MKYLFNHSEVSPFFAELSDPRVSKDLIKEMKIFIKRV